MADFRFTLEVSRATRRCVVEVVVLCAALCVLLIGAQTRALRSWGMSPDGALVAATAIFLCELALMVVMMWWRWVVVVARPGA